MYSLATPLTIVACFVAGLLLRRYSKLPPSGPEILLKILANIILPALVIAALRNVMPTAGHFWAVAGFFLIFAVACVVFLGLYRLRLMTKETALCLILCSGAGEIGLVGLPFAEAFFGKSSVGSAVFFDQMAGVLLLNLAVLPLIRRITIGEFNWRPAVRSYVTSAAFIGLILAIAIRFIRPGEWIYAVTWRIGETYLPLASLYLGWQWKPEFKGVSATAITAGVLFKFVAAPLLILLVAQATGLRPDIRKIAVLEAATGTMMVAGLYAVQLNLNAPLARALWGLSFPLAFIAAIVVRVWLR